MPHSLSYETYRDKVHAGWLGKSIGGLCGAPLENQKQLHALTPETIWPAEIGANDDLDLQLVWLEALQERGPWLTSEDLAEFWQDRCWYNFLDYGYFLYNLQRGIAPPLSGTFGNEFFYESEGCPIRSEIWGMVCPNNPGLAAELACYDGQLDHGGMSVEIERFQSAMAACAFVCANVNEVLEKASPILRYDSTLPEMIREVRTICQDHPDHAQAWRLVIRRYGHRDASKAVTNFALVLMALFLSNGDFRHAMLIVVNSGWDTDCTAATVGALLGILGGTKVLPKEWTDKLDPHLTCALNIPHKDVSLDKLTDDTCQVGIEITHTRNVNIELIDSPDVLIRSKPIPRPEIHINYPAAPVLWAQRKTPVEIQICNRLDCELTGAFEITHPEHLCCTQNRTVLTLPPGGVGTVNVDISLRAGETWLQDKNLLTARWTGANTCHVEKTFGLAGARHWLVYGPYWDMWDKDTYDVCPYHNREVICHPCKAGCGSDSYNQYARLEGQYLDEAKLLHEELPAELPMRLETATDLITQDDLGGFLGQACYYFVRTLQSSQPANCGVSIGRTGPYRAWVDGQELQSRSDIRSWTPWEQEHVKYFDFEGVPRRLVIKAVRVGDEFKLSTTLIGGGDPERKRGISWFLDCLSNRIVTGER